MLADGRNYGVHPVFRADVRCRMRCPDDVPAAPVVDIDNGFAARAGRGRLREVKSKVLIHAPERRRPADDDDVGGVEVDLLGRQIALSRQNESEARDWRLCRTSTTKQRFGITR